MVEKSAKKASKTLILNQRRKKKKGVDNGWKCGIINKLSRKTAALQKPNKSDVPAKTQRGTGQRAGRKLLKGVWKAQKNIEKVLDKKYDIWYNEWAVREESKQDLENWTILKLVEP